jgi:DNA-binding PadR family transcriptional regulator
MTVGGCVRDQWGAGDWEDDQTPPRGLYSITSEGVQRQAGPANTASQPSQTVEWRRNFPALFHRWSSQLDQFQTRP